MKKRVVRHAFTEAECKRLKNYLKTESTVYYMLFNLGISSSFYYTDLARLTLNDLKRLLKIKRCNKNNLIEFQYLNRIVYVDSAIRPLLQAYVDEFQHKNGKMQAFFNRFGRPFREDVVSHYLEYWCDAAKCCYGSLRKTFFKTLYDRGVSLEDLRNYLRYNLQTDVLKYLNLSISKHHQTLQNSIKSSNIQVTEDDLKYLSKFNELQLKVLVKLRDEEIKKLKAQLDAIYQTSEIAQEIIKRNE